MWEFVEWVTDALFMLLLVMIFIVECVVIDIIENFGRFKQRPSFVAGRD